MMGSTAGAATLTSWILMVGFQQGGVSTIQGLLSSPIQHCWRIPDIAITHFKSPHRSKMVHLSLMRMQYVFILFCFLASGVCYYTSMMECCNTLQSGGIEVSGGADFVLGSTNVRVRFLRAGGFGSPLPGISEVLLQLCKQDHVTEHIATIQISGLILTANSMSSLGLLHHSVAFNGRGGLY